MDQLSLVTPDVGNYSRVMVLLTPPVREKLRRYSEVTGVSSSVIVEYLIKSSSIKEVTSAHQEGHFKKRRVGRAKQSFHD